MKKQITLTYDIYNSIEELEENDRNLLKEARLVTKLAYAPYSNFRVGAVARMKTGEIIIGTNQENASYPVGLCAERVLLSSASSVYPGIPIETIAISYHNVNDNGISEHPVAPCGVCRQSLHEFEERMNQPVRLVLSGMEGNVYVIQNAGSLLPLAFSKNELI